MIGGSQLFQQSLLEFRKTSARKLLQRRNVKKNKIIPDEVGSAEDPTGVHKYKLNLVSFTYLACIRLNSQILYTFMSSATYLFAKITKNGKHC